MAKSKKQFQVQVGTFEVQGSHKVIWSRWSDHKNFQLAMTQHQVQSGVEQDGRSWRIVDTQDNVAHTFIGGTWIKGEV